MAVYSSLVKVLEAENHSLDTISLFGARARNYEFSMDMPDVFRRLPKVIMWNRNELFAFYCDIHRYAYPYVSLEAERQELRYLTEELFNLPLRLIKEDIRRLSTEDVYVISSEAMSRSLHETAYFPHYVHLSLGLYVKGFYGHGPSFQILNYADHILNCTDRCPNSTEDEASDTDESTTSSTEYITIASHAGDSAMTGNEIDPASVLSVSEYDEEEELEENVPTE